MVIENVFDFLIFFLEGGGIFSGSDVLFLHFQIK